MASVDATHACSRFRLRSLRFFDRLPGCFQHDGFSILERNRKLSLTKRDSIPAEEFGSPAMQSGDIIRFAGRELLKIGIIGNQPRRHAILACPQTQQSLQQIQRCR